MKVQYSILVVVSTLLLFCVPSAAYANCKTCKTTLQNGCSCTGNRSCQCSGSGADKVCICENDVGPGKAEGTYCYLVNGLCQCVPFSCDKGFDVSNDFAEGGPIDLDIKNPHTVQEAVEDIFCNDVVL